MPWLFSFFKAPSVRPSLFIWHFRELSIYTNKCKKTTTKKQSGKLKIFLNIRTVFFALVPWPEISSLNFRHFYLLLLPNMVTFVAPTNISYFQSGKSGMEFSCTGLSEKFCEFGFSLLDFFVSGSFCFETANFIFSRIQRFLDFYLTRIFLMKKVTIHFGTTSNLVNYEFQIKCFLRLWRAFHPSRCSS